MCFERTDRAISIGRSPLCGGSLIICYMFFLTLMHPLEVITSFWYPNIIWGEKLLYSHFPPYLPRGEKCLYSHFSGGKIYYIAIFPPIQVRGNMAMGENGSIPPALSATTFRGTGFVYVKNWKNSENSSISQLWFLFVIYLRFIRALVKGMFDLQIDMKEKKKKIVLNE
jgi:hypothetical protein